MGYECSWSGMRKYLEKEMLADSLKGRVRYGCTTYVGMDGCKIFEVCIDDQKVKCFSWETVNNYFIEKGYKTIEKPYGVTEYWDEFWSLLNKYPLNERTEYIDSEFADALAEYRNQDIKSSVESDNPIVRMFAVLDRRVGKRTLEELKDALAEQPEWLKRFYVFRLEAENM
ncbi:MAG: hypothetical protein IJC37_01260 [Clostridia bacterium]|nr:hypothetical protein [Clostridia bacterium]